VAFWVTGFIVGFLALDLFPVWITGRWLAAGMGIDTNPTDKKFDDSHQNA